MTIGERITDVVPQKRPAFDINKTCTLSSTSWYVLNVYPSWYFDLWARDIVRHVHLRAMRHIQTLAEKS